MNPIILASTSSYRKALLGKLGLDFTTASPQIDETANPGETATQLVQRLAFEKANAIAKTLNEGLVIGSDQVAVLELKSGDSILGKPHTHDNAVKQLIACQGKTVTFYTGLCVINAATQQAHQCIDPFHVYFRQLTDRQIHNYLEREQPYDCAGSFKSEGLGISLFSKLEGDDPNTLVGLPLIRLVEILESEGIEII